MRKYKFNRRQLEKIADQARILSWAMGAVVNYLYNGNIYVKIAIISVLWFILQIVAIIVEGDNDVR